MSSSAPSHGSTLPSKRKNQTEDGQDPSSKKQKDASPSDLKLDKLRLASEDNVPKKVYQPPLLPVCVTQANQNEFFMDDDPDYELNALLTACWETRFRTNVTNHERWAKTVSVRGLTKLRKQITPERSRKLFGIRDIEKSRKLIDVFISMRRHAMKVVAFSAKAKMVPVQKQLSERWVHVV